MLNLHKVGVMDSYLLMKYKALFLDLDGTTVPNRIDGMPSDRVVTAIKHLQKKIHVCIATGRHLEMVTPIIERLNLTNPCILLNGAEIYDPNAKKIIKEWEIPKESVAEILSIFAHTSYRVYFEPGVYGAGGLQPKNATKATNLFVGEIKRSQIGKVTKQLQHIPFITIHKMGSWSKDLIDIAITHSDASKQHGILYLAKMLEFTPAETIGVGDSHNDYSLLMACGLRFAMGNAVPEVKELADFIAPSIDQDGLAIIIEKFILPLVSQ